MEIVCLDLEGVLLPEIWINLAESTGIKELSVTTRDVPDYRKLMLQRLKLLKENELGIESIQKVVGGMSPLDGAVDFLRRLQSEYQVFILSDTFYEISKPLIEQLGWPTLFCHNLVIDSDGNITDFKLRMEDHKRHAVVALKKLNFKVIAAGDSYYDLSMLREADKGFLFNAPENVIKEYPEFYATNDYDQLKLQFLNVNSKR